MKKFIRNHKILSIAICIASILILAAITLSSIALSLRQADQTANIVTDGIIVTLTHYHSSTTVDGKPVENFQTGVLFADGRSFGIIGWPELALNDYYTFTLEPTSTQGLYKAIKIESGLR